MSVDGKKIATQLAKSWEKSSQKVSYKRASVRESNEQIVKKAKDKLYDRAMLEQSERNGNQSQKMQHEILHSIIEKRQASAVHKNIDYSEALYVSSNGNVYYRRCILRS